ncbi:hypothetical protein BpHYR1_027197 [Brachionus plicatilis]|uniref:Uncharacterized protein n=1 Tax=Brachionus plicatilis TaxID=10195 RepID=A0A3M7P7I9_BRAPC|nr:hypothetical protein BpHYR1_027197 [Brachionus plicatilis]
MEIRIVSYFNFAKFLLKYQIFNHESSWESKFRFVPFKHHAINFQRYKSKCNCSKSELANFFVNLIYLQYKKRLKLDKHAAKTLALETNLLSEKKSIVSKAYGNN